MSLQKLPNTKKPTGRVFLVLVLTGLYMVAEAVGGFLSNSLALLADAGHMLTDVAALTISLLAFFMSSRPANEKATFGYHRAEILAALLNGVVLLLASFFLIKEAASRLFSETSVQSALMIQVAVGGLLINIIGLLLLNHNKKSHSLNLKAAWLHVLSDTLGSIGVIVSGLLIHFYGFTIADPLASIIIAGLVLFSSLRLIAQTLQILMEHTPAHIDTREIVYAIKSLAMVESVHDLHVWSISSGRDSLSAHVVAKKNADYDRLLEQINEILTLKFGISHITIQIESECQTIHQVCS